MHVKFHQEICIEVVDKQTDKHSTYQKVQFVTVTFVTK